MMRIFLIIFLGLLIGCKKVKPVRIVDSQESGSSIAFRDFIRRAFDKNGIIKWQLDAKRAFIYIKENKTVVYGVIFKQFDKGVYKSTITGKKAIIDHGNKNAHLEGNIVVESTEKRILKAEVLDYDLEEGLLNSEGDVEILSEGLKITGKGFRADKNLKKYTILKPTGITQGNPLKDSTPEEGGLIPGS